MVKFNSTEGLGYAQARAFETLLKAHRKTFLKRPGRLKTYEHKLRVIPHTPFRATNYPIPLAYIESVDQEIDRIRIRLGNYSKMNEPIKQPDISRWQERR